MIPSIRASLPYSAGGLLVLVSTSAGGISVGLASLATLSVISVAVKHRAAANEHLPTQREHGEPLLSTVVVSESEQRDRDRELAALRQRNETLVGEKAELARLLKEKEAELHALTALQISSLEAHKSHEASPHASPHSMRASCVAGSIGAEPRLPPGRPPSVPAAVLVPPAAPPPPPWQPPASSDERTQAPVQLRARQRSQRTRSQREDVVAQSPPSSILDDGGAEEARGSMNGNKHASLAGRADTRLVAEEVAAAADKADFESSAPLHVEVDNEADETCTVVRIIAPDRAQLLTDLTSGTLMSALTPFRAPCPRTHSLRSWAHACAARARLSCSCSDNHL